MSRKELTRLEMIHAVVERRIRQSQAARLLGLPVRQIKRLCRAFPDAESKRRAMAMHSVRVFGTLRARA